MKIWHVVLTTLLVSALVGIGLGKIHASEGSDLVAALVLVLLCSRAIDLVSVNKLTDADTTKDREDKPHSDRD